MYVERACLSLTPALCNAEGIAVNRVIEAYSRQKPIDKTQVFKLEGLETCVLIFIWASGVLKNVLELIRSVLQVMGSTFINPTDQRAMILEVSHRVTDEGCMAKIFAGNTPSITVRKQEYEGEALWDMTVSIVVHSTAVESPIRFCPLTAAGHAARSIPSGRNASLITIIKEFLRSPKATAYPSLVKS
ncbi:hypothetical protein G5I_12621 [Acromyrmex echinatior]|uniref:Uncharacterized protein n=1 Tax=Acromyrmex echinatior TaxID=103372 RepID=F4X2U0_ACREC|nr:hypothetical protein G5I_12621 [Acromyrmex echinatior]